MKAKESAQKNQPNLSDQNRSAASVQNLGHPVAEQSEPEDQNAAPISAPDSSYVSSRIGIRDLFVVTAIAVVALSLSAALRFEMNVGFLTAISVGITVLIVLVVGHRLVRQLLTDSESGMLQSSVGKISLKSDKLERQLERIDELAEGLKDLKSQFSDGGTPEVIGARDKEVQRLANEMSKLEQQLHDLRNSFHQTREEQRQYVRSELQIVETLVKQIAENLTDRNILNLSGVQSELRTSEEAESSSVYSPGVPPASAPSPLSGIARSEQSETSGMDMGGASGSNLLEVVRESIATNKIDLYLQPIVSLPGRKVRYYEVLTRLRTASNQTMLPASYIPVAEQAGLMPLIDNVMLFRSVQIMSRLVEREPARGLFCNISPHSLLDADFFPEFIDFMEQHAGYAGALFFEFGQSMIKKCSPLELEGLTTLYDLGFRFSMDGVTDLDIDFTELHKRGFRFIKVDASVLIHGMAEAGSRIHAADMRDYLKRYSLDLIVQKIEGEPQLSELLKFEVDFGQGFLFAEPRPVRPEIFGQLRKENSADKAA